MGVNRSREYQVKFWLFEEEKQMLIKSCYEANLSQSDYLRQLIMAGSISGRQWTMNEEQGKKLLYEINRIGNNINQIAYNTNAKAFASHADWEALKEKYYELLNLLGAIPFLSKEAQEEWQLQAYMLLQKQ